MRIHDLALVLALGMVPVSAHSMQAQTPLGTAFTYQGRLTDNAQPADGPYDLRFLLFDAPTNGSQIGPELILSNVPVTSGLFTVALDFDALGPAFTGDASWLEIGVRPGGSGGPFTILIPRQEMTPSPNALFASMAADAELLGGQPPSSYQLRITGACAPGQAIRVVNADGTVECEVAGGDVTAVDTPPGSGLQGGAASGSVSLGLLGTCGAGEILKWNGSAWGCAADDTGAGWDLTGNAGTDPATDFLGTTDTQPLDLRVNGVRALRIQPGSPPSLIGGDANGVVDAGVNGAGIGSGSGNRVTDDLGVVAGGSSNRAGNATGSTSDAAGGAVGGGFSNIASGVQATVPGGSFNEASGSFSLAAGLQAKASHSGAFVWADSTAADLVSTAPNQFLVRAAGGVGINTNAPASALDVNGTATVDGFRLTTSPSAGFVLTSDASGTGTWQATASGGGDITAVNTPGGSGLQGGVASGDANLSLADLGVTTARLADAAVTSLKIADGTIALADLGPNGCASGQVLKWNGTAWTCAADADTTYSAGAGLSLAGSTFSIADLGVTTPKLADGSVMTAKIASGAVTSGTIADGTIAFADVGPNGCSSGQVMKWNGAAWACAADANSGGTVTAVTGGTGLTGGTITTSGTLAVAFGGGGAATTASRSDHAHFGQTWTGSGAGLRVESTTLDGLQGISTATSGGSGVLGASSSPTGVGVLGRVSSSSGYGGYFENLSGGPALGVNTGGIRFGDGTTQTTAAVGSAGDITAVNAGTGLIGGGTSGDVTLAVNPATVQSRVSGVCVAGSSIRTVNADGTVVCEPDDDTPAWNLTGNAGTNPATNFIGTTDNQAFELRVNNLRALHIQPGAPSGLFQGPDVVLGYEGNSVEPGVNGAVVGGGGVVAGFPAPNRVTGHFGTVAGGVFNVAGDADPTTSPFATVGGGYFNIASGWAATLAGGRENRATGVDAATIGGGFRNQASGIYATIGGGADNVASGTPSTVPGGYQNVAGGDYSFTAGNRAKVRDAAQSGDANGDEGTFVWADSTNLDFTSTGPNQFLVRAAGGVGINKNNPSSALDVNGSIRGASASGNGVEGSSTSAGALGVYGRALANTGFSIGVRGDTSSPDGIAVWGYSTTTASTGFPIGVEGRSDSPNGIAVNGFAPASSGVNFGVRGFTNSPQGFGGYFGNLGGGPALGVNTGGIRFGDGTTQTTAAVASAGDITAVNAGTGLTGGGTSGDVTLAVNPTAVQSRVNGTCAPGSSIRTVNQDGTVVCEPDDDTAGWNLTGNAGTNPATNFIGTTDAVPFEVRVNNQRALRLERVQLTTGSAYVGSNVLAGDSGNVLMAGVTLATIAGGGGEIDSIPHPNRVSDVGGTVGGGANNSAGNEDANLDGVAFATVAGGTFNTASGYASAVAGGHGNTASGTFTAVAGGFLNSVSGFGSAAAGGQGNTASGTFSTVAGGFLNSAGGDLSLAAGSSARVRTPAEVGGGDFDGDQGTLVWADSSPTVFQSTGPNQFLIRAAGGVGINTNAPAAGSSLTVSGDTRMTGNLGFGSSTRQMLNLWDTGYGIGVQSSTTYFRSDEGFAWFQGGTHSDAQNDPGGGQRQMRLDADGNLFVQGAFSPGGADFAEMLPAQDDVAAGDVLVIGPDGRLTLSTEPYQDSLAGVYSTKPGLLGGAADGEDLTGKIPLAVSGVVPVKVTAENGPIRPGDSLTSSSTPGRAMRASKVRIGGVAFFPSGVILGKALEPLGSGEGVIQALVVLQ